MQHRDDAEMAIPSLQEDSAERRRLLNVLAQRRYSRTVRTRRTVRRLTLIGRRKREKMQSLEAQVDGLITPPASTNTAMAINDSIDRQPTPLNSRGRDTTEIAFDLPYFSNSGFSDLLGPLDGIDTFAPWEGQSLGSVAGITEQISISTSTPPIRAAPVADDDFADYIISTPGLNVVRAHTEIFDRLLGPGLDLDIFNPRTVSPIALGAEIRLDPLLAHFQPSPLQRRIKHHPIIDVLPWPSFRDRFLFVMSLRKEQRPKIARQEMHMVTLELMMSVKDAGGGIKVWDLNSFAPESWEIGQTFYSKFWWAIDGDIVRNSNRHRALRGERNLDHRNLGDHGP
ncbi:hypothetical protein ANO11243_038220 [Dothideomycetidae sp. 11243]|nr:hypothetical protein ANO11243_038220 [fungal sp. No.11243]